MSEILDVDHLTGIVETFHKEDGKIHVRKTQEVGEMLTANKRDRSESSTGWKGDLHKVASIPMNVIYKWREELKRKGLDPNPLAKTNKPFLIAKLNDPDWKYLRTKDGFI
jgi:hypothetical protein